MKLIERLLHYKAASVNVSEPLETVVPDELIKHYPEPSERLQGLLRKAPGTGKMLFQYFQHKDISMDWKYWATDLLENGIETPGIIQLAGEDLDLFPTEFTELLDTVFKELDVEINQEAAYCSYVLGIAEEVIRGERTARSGLRTDNVNEWTHQFFEKLVKANEKYCTTFYQG